MIKRILFLFVISSLMISSHNVQAVESRYIVLIDVSGSMAGKGTLNTPNIFPQVKKAIMTYLTEAIPIGSEVMIIPFAQEARSSKTYFLDGSHETNKRIAEYIDSLVADGLNTNIYGTLYDTLQFAAEKGESSIIVYLFTDGKDNVNARTFSELSDKFKSVKKDNPFLWIYYTDLSSNKDSSELNKFGDLGWSVTPLDPHVAPHVLEQNIEKMFETQKKIMEEEKLKLAEEKARLEKEKQQLQKDQEQINTKEKELKSRASEIQEQLNKLSELKAEDAEKRLKLQEELNRIQQERKKNDSLRENLLQQEKQLKDLKKEMVQTKSELDEAAMQRKEIKQLLKVADQLVVEASSLEKDAAMTKLKEAMDKYKAVLKKEADNVKALSGLKKAKQLFWERKNFFEKFWYYIILGAIFLVFFFLVIRRPLIKWWDIDPIVLNASYNPKANHLEPDVTVARSFLRKRFRKKGDEYFIARINGQNIQIEHEAVSAVRHAVIYRLGNNLYLEKRSGNISDENNNPVEGPMKLGQEESVFLTDKNIPDQSVKVVLSIK